MPTHTAHRQAFGAKRHRTEAAQVRDIAHSIQGFEREGVAWTWERYGLQANPAKQAKVLAALGRTDRMIETRTYARPAGDLRGTVVLYHLPGMRDWVVNMYVGDEPGSGPEAMERVPVDDQPALAEANALCWAGIYELKLVNDYGMARVA
jgi:hypothetical protein